MDDELQPFELFLDFLFGIIDKVYKSESYQVEEKMVSEVWMRLSPLQCAKFLGHSPGELPENLRKAYQTLGRLRTRVDECRPTRTLVEWALAQIRDAISSRINTLRLAARKAA